MLCCKGVNDCLSSMLVCSHQLNSIHARHIISCTVHLCSSKVVNFFLFASFTCNFHKLEPVHLHIALSTSFVSSESPTLTGTYLWTARLASSLPSLEDILDHSIFAVRFRVFQAHTYKCCSLHCKEKIVFATTPSFFSLQPRGD
jgi:hypothetical protein